MKPEGTFWNPFNEYFVSEITVFSGGVFSFQLRLALIRVQAFIKEDSNSH